MEYQISYLSPGGHIKKLVDAFAEALPTVPVICDLELESVTSADTHLVGFELSFDKTIPFKVMDFLDSLSGKSIFVFVTTPFVPNDFMWKQICRKLIPFIPNNSNFCGFHICPAQPSHSMLEALHKRLSVEPNNANLQQWLEQCEKATGRPNELDISKSCEFMCHVLGVENG